MSYHLVGHSHTLEAGVDLSDSRHCAIAVDSSTPHVKAILPSAGGPIVGILMNSPEITEEASIQHRDIVEWKAGGTVAPQDKVRSDAQGRCVVCTAAEIASGQAQGVVYEGATVGLLATVFLYLNPAGASASPYADVALDTGALTNYGGASIIYFSVADTKSAALPAGRYVGQQLQLICDATTGTPNGSVTGTFLSQAGVAGTSLAFNAAGDSATLVWTGAAWRVIALNSVTLT